jgi:hypothetical protein
LSIQVPGRMSTKVLLKGLHRTQGRVAVGIEKIARVTMVKYTYCLGHPSVKRVNVTPKEILLNMMASVDMVRPVAP